MSSSLSRILISMLVAFGFIAGAPIAAMSHLNTAYFVRPNAVHETYLYSFRGTPDGYFPTNITEFNGAFYGTTQGGGAHGAGSFFVLCKTKSGYQERVLYSFSSGASLSGSPLAVNSSGVFFGTTNINVFALVPTAAGYVHKIVYSFDQNRDGEDPNSPVVFDGYGALYGSTSSFGPKNGGTVFKLTPSKSGYSEKVLYAFGTTNGFSAEPAGPLLVDGAGDVYGVTQYGGFTGGNLSLGGGIAFELTHTASGYVEHVLYRFGSHTGDGTRPINLVFNAATGTFFGSAFSGGGGSGCLGQGCGTIFELFPKEDYREQTVHAFDGTNGYFANAPLVPDGKGDLYGVTEDSGSPLSGYGVLFKLAPSTKGFAYSVLYQFNGPSGGFNGPNDGRAPSWLLFSNDTFFGVTDFGGQYDNSSPLGNGTFFELAL